jgi:hypothetical protein
MLGVSSVVAKFEAVFVLLLICWRMLIWVSFEEYLVLPTNKCCVVEHNLNT